ncbi:isoprenyl synthetase [Marivirga tractuosa]|uniref:Polyprenyl synthetase n=1 Tax=Marivirga tractuosa (strain ATCC 23168 / DSM 4126 / NBRC 15989 / NCIMB 1408 / VKM B-1430 / H-43) TaxID=643867 RepID=E4TNQ8_MARTH|nr:polyprenyl synthetase family protein [Marivirga tractuosa]ADR21495.1 Polyprenyl synthetase [Marivirga tractuosa DSM 4126]BDD14051.1 isoprenyl synthetase [Marivirga tractuosa]
MNQSIKEYIVSINSAIEQEDFGDKPQELYEPIRYIMSLGGKRMRPLLSLLSYQLYKDNIKEVIPASIAVEIFHNFTLMHDDIMDNAPLRRGQQTVHEKWNSPVAILSGDVMLVKAYQQLIANSPTEKLTEILEKFNRCAIEVCEGQQIDMNFEEQEQVQEADYIEMIRLKTAVLLGFSLEFGGILAMDNEADQALLYQMGVNAGIGFQLMDDLLDVYADQDKFGKQVGGDIIANKKTYLLIKANELAQGENSIKLHDWLKAQDFDNEEKVNAVKSIYDELHIKTLTEAKMNEYFEKAFTNLEDLDAPSEKKNIIKDFFNYLINREQ